MELGNALVFDTETTGLFQFKDEDGNSVPADAPGQPRMLALAATLIDPHGGELDRMYELVRPDGFTVDEDGEAFKVNGLSNERLMDEGIPIAQVLDQFDLMTDECAYIAAFSVAFDQKMVRAEQRRAGRDDRYGYRPTFEIMFKARSLACKSVGPHSNPKKLIECFENITGMSLEDAHDAQGDLDATVDILRHLLINDMVEPKAQVSKK